MVGSVLYEAMVLMVFTYESNVDAGNKAINCVIYKPKNILKLNRTAIYFSPNFKKKQKNIGSKLVIILQNYTLQHK